MQSHPTIGFISTWPVYQGTTMDRYAHSLIQGISAAARDLQCSLLLGCGFSVTGKSRQRSSFWPVPGPGVDFVPVGPWNTDGLIIVPDELTAEQSSYVHDLIKSGFPVVFTTPEGPGSVVTVDNALGIHQAFTHLREHGHERIAFIAGNTGDRGDSGERLRAYINELRGAGMPVMPELIAYGEHKKDDGASAMQKILASGVPFSAVIASNDLSCLGAIETLTAAGKRIPQDVAVIGFDDILDARSITPALTTIRHPTCALGYQAVSTIKEVIEKKRSEFSKVIVPPQLIIRQSCGCRAAQMLPLSGHLLASLPDMAQEMAEAAFTEARNVPFEQLKTECLAYLRALTISLENNSVQPVLDETERLLTWAEERGEDAQLWQTGTDILIHKIDSVAMLVPAANPSFASNMLNRTRLEIGENIQRQITRSLVTHMDMMAQLGQLTAEMLAAVNLDESAEILTRWLPRVGIKNALVALYIPDEEENTLHSTVLFGTGSFNRFKGLRFISRQFPIPEIITPGQLMQLTILPLKVDEKTTGFVAFDAPNPELCAAIVHNLSAALRTSRLYQDAIEGRRLAEEANHLKSRFLSTVSHELRTPLSLIVGLSEMALKAEKVEARDIEQINTSAQHLARLIGDVLDLASSEAGQLRILREPIDLSEVIRLAAKIGEELAREKGLEWKMRMPESGPFVLGDRTRLRQITLNLLSNAVKFTTTGQIVLDVHPSNGQALMSVSDTGVGIPPADLDAIFNEFYRSEWSLKSGVGGLGLGLAITRQLVEQHDGKITVSSPGELGCGSTFTIQLPLISSPVSQSGVFNTLLSDNPHVILLAENVSPSTGLSEFLEGRGYQVTPVIIDTTPDWLSQVAAAAPAAFILDESLATSQGWTIAASLKQQIPTQNIPILAYALDPQRNRGELFELNTFFKPLKAEQLNQILPAEPADTDQHAVILVVDDDPGILNMHCRMIHKTCRQTLTARNGREALQVLEHSRPDLILLDLMMPEMDGFEFLDALHTRQDLRDIPVIILTARTLSDTDLERCNRGVTNILGKGIFSADETLNHIEAALTRQNTLGSATRQLVRRAMSFIQVHFAEPLTRELIAEQIGISADYLSECFRQELGITPIAYIRRYRIHQACELLRNTGLPITRIGMDVGFSESAHFTHTFQREMGLTPRAYRNKGRE